MKLQSDLKVNITIENHEIDPFMSLLTKVQAEATKVGFSKFKLEESETIIMDSLIQFFYENSEDTDEE